MPGAEGTEQCLHKASTGAVQLSGSRGPTLEHSPAEQAVRGEAAQASHVCRELGRNDTISGELK